MHVRAVAALLMPDDFGRPIVPAAHHRLWLDLVCDESIKKLLIIAPPGSAKTSWTSAYLAAVIGFHPEKSIVITSVSDDVAEKRSLMLRGLTETAEWQAAFPEARRLNGKWEQKEWTLANVPGRIHPTMRSYGTGASITGSRADLILADDILDIDNTRTQGQREKDEEWFHSTLMSRLKKNGRIIVIGTQYNAQDLYAHLRKDPTWTICHTPLLSSEDDGFYADVRRDGLVETVKLHDGKTVWPGRWSEQDAEELRATTPPVIFETTYQGYVTSGAQARIFLEEWWTGKNRFRYGDHRPIARYISLDTAESEKEGAAYTAWAVGDLMPDYSLRIIEIGRERLGMPQLVKKIESLYTRFQDKSGLLRGMVIEAKSSGYGALQTLRQGAIIPENVLAGYNPKVDKQTRWNEAAVWCSLGMVLFPHPSDECPWLHDAEEELFSLPNAEFFDQADSFSQLVGYLSNYLSAGYRSKNNGDTE